MAIYSGDGWMDEKADENKYDVYENFICMFFFFSLSSSSSYSSQLLGLNGRWWLGVWCQLHSPFNHNLCSDDSWWLTDDARFYNINGIKCLLCIWKLSQLMLDLVESYHERNCEVSYITSEFVEESFWYLSVLKIYKGTEAEESLFN